MNPAPHYDAAIIGGGHNGLACAALLAKAGLSVALFERSAMLGGAAVSDSPWPASASSSVSYVSTLLDAWLVRELELERHGYVDNIAPFTTLSVLPDGRSLLLGLDERENDAEISWFDHDDAQGYRDLRRLLSDLGNQLFNSYSDEEALFEHLPARVQNSLLGSAAEMAERYINTPVLQAAVTTEGIIGTNAGPRDAGTAYALAHRYAAGKFAARGAWGSTRRGVNGASGALASAARAFGAELWHSKVVTSIAVVDDAACGVVLAGGHEIRARVIISNAHPRTTFLDLAGREHFTSAFLERVRHWKTTGAVFKLELMLGEMPNFKCRPERATQNITAINVAPSIDYMQKAHEDAKDGGMSKQPVLACVLQAAGNPGHSSSGTYMLSVLAQYYPYDSKDGWSGAQREAVADRLVYLLAQYAPNLPSAIEERTILSPLDLEARFGLVGGHIFHGELLPGQIYESRFATRTPLNNLYLCGSGAHPGGGVTGFPGRRAANAVLADLAAKRVAP